VGSAAGPKVSTRQNYERSFDGWWTPETMEELTDEELDWRHPDLANAGAKLDGQTKWTIACMVVLAMWFLSVQFLH
jgi:hypothetical protein